MSEIQVRHSHVGWDGPIRGLFISAPGAGKTSLMLSYPNVFVFDFDRTLHLGVPKHIRDRLDVNFLFIQPDSWQDIWVWTMRIIKGEPLDLPDGKKFQVKTIGVDTIGVAYDQFITKVSRTFKVAQMMGKDGKPLMVMDTRTKVAEDDHRALMTMADFGFSRERLLEWINTLKKFPGHLVVNGHEQLRDPIEGSVKPAKGTVALPGGLREDLPGMWKSVV